MKWKAAPLTFTLALLLGFLPGALLLVPAIQGLWENRGARAAAFPLLLDRRLLAYLELIASKPALYTVQAMFPAAAAAVALALDVPSQAAGIAPRHPAAQLAPAVVARAAGNDRAVCRHPLRRRLAPSFLVVVGAILVTIAVHARGAAPCATAAPPPG